LSIFTCTSVPSEDTSVSEDTSAQFELKRKILTSYSTSTCLLTAFKHPTQKQ